MSVCQTWLPLLLWLTLAAAVAADARNEWSAVLDDVVLIVKTGHEVIEERLRPLLEGDTQLRYFKNILVASNDASAWRGANVSVFDAVSNMSFVLRAHELLEKKPLIYAGFLARTPAHVRKRTPGQKTKGWFGDQHKNLPAFRHAMQLYPNAKWYFMTDDDTYVSARNLAAFVVKTADTPGGIYAGNIMGCACCGEGQNERYRRLSFAHGGSGILLSRTACTRMVAMLDACIFRFSYCWAGDIQVAVCLLGLEPPIYVQQLAGSHSEPPGVTLSGSHGHWCEAPITFHHLTPLQYLGISALEDAHWRTHATPFLLGAVVDQFFLAPLAVNRTVSQHQNGTVTCIGNTTDDGATLFAPVRLPVTADANEQLRLCTQSCTKEPACMAFLLSTSNRSCTLRQSVTAHVHAAALSFCYLGSRIKARFVC